MNNKIIYDNKNIDVKKIIDQIDELNNDKTTSERSFSNDDVFNYEINIKPQFIVDEEISSLIDIERTKIILFEGNIERTKGLFGYIKYMLKRILRKGTHKFFEELAEKQSEFNEAVFTYIVKNSKDANKNDK